jgi:hypothetical protein
MICKVLLLVLGAYGIGANSLANVEGASEDDMELLNCLEHVSYARVPCWLFAVLT